MTNDRCASLGQVVTLALGLVSLSACGQGHTINNGPLLGGAGKPVVNLGGQTGATTVTATYPSPCEIDLEFGDVPIGPGDTVTVQIENVGSRTLDLSQVDPTLDPAFSLNYGTQQPIQPGALGQFTVSFQPTAIGPVESTFTIPTDGINTACTAPPGDEGGSILTVGLTGTGVAT